MPSLKLHLGCGEKHLEGFTNIDARDIPGVDEVNDITQLRNYTSNSVDLIYASHVLEHTGRYSYYTVLERWFELLKPGGSLRLAVPDFEAICAHYSEHKNIKVLMGLLYGGQTYPENFHYVGFDFASLSADLLQIGFSHVQRYDHRKTEHAHIDDFSAAYLPHMDPTGRLMSLNIVGIK